MNHPIVVKNLCFQYGDKTILKNVSTEFDGGSFTAVIGPNGSGKTTFIKNLVKILEPRKNVIEVLGKDLHSYSHKALSQKMSCVPQTTQIEFDFTVEDVVMMGRYPYLKRFQSETSDDMAIVERAMKATGVYEFKDKPINTLSGGEIQRAIIARALAQEPEILILDEPISHLDIHHQLELMQLIRELAKEKGITVIAILHDLNFAMDYSDQVIMLKDGEIFVKGSPEKVINTHNIKMVYDIDVCLIQNPVTGNPHVIPLNRAV